MTNSKLAFGFMIAISYLRFGHPLEPLNIAIPTLKEGIKSYSGYKLVRTDVFPSQSSALEYLEESRGVEVLAHRPKGRSLSVDFLVSPEAEEKTLQIFKNSKLEFQEIVNNLQEVIDEEMDSDNERSDSVSAQEMSWDNYHSYEVMYNYMKHLAELYPHLVTLQKIGESFEKRQLIVLKISSGKDKPAIWIDGGVHAREWISPATALFIVRQLVEFNSENAELLDMFDWYILPMANPDGYEYSRHHDRMWRKTRSRHPGSRSSCVGVDPNRNFGYQWATVGYSQYPCSPIFAGSHAFSEPETVAMRDFLKQHKDHLKIYLSIHAYSQLWLLPWGHIATVPKNYDDLYEVARLTAAAIKAYNGTEYTVGQVSKLLYRASGSASDFAYGVLGIPFVYGLELRDLGKYGFMLPSDQIYPTGIETFEGIKVLAAEVNKKLPKYQNFGKGLENMKPSNGTTAINDIDLDVKSLQEI